MFEIENLHAEIDGQVILNGLNLKVAPGEIHALMGPNGAGKSTLAKVCTGHPAYEVSQGNVLFEGESILELEPEERAKLGLFMSFQYPLEIAGITNRQFLTHAMKARGTAKDLDECAEKMQIKPEFLERDLNSGFSGGEKKRNEILQLVALDPKLAILDETDSGLDIDAMRIVAGGVNHWFTPDKGLILITHYQRLLDYIKPHFVHIVIEGRIVRSGGPELAHELEKTGYACSN
ncbi:MAG: Fe-S cluster assembly ATPase SufC [Chlamydiia bacterium]|nr:Fe-S cluster assembly ATPase SufC [Chlamydiia bacterium]MCP5492156.1 Fe-S cluster assembly ATPase SufC [Chlamydiales bacterium]